MKNKFLSKSVPRGTRTIWRYLGALFILFTFAIGNVWAAETIFSATFKGSWSQAVKESDNNKVVPTNNVTLSPSGVSAIAYTTRTGSSGRTAQISSNAYNIAVSNDLFLKLVLASGTTIQEGDVIRLNGTSNKTVVISDEASTSSKPTASTNTDYAVPGGSALIGKGVVYLTRSTSSTTLTSITIVRPDMITLNANGGKVNGENSIAYGMSEAGILPRAEKGSMRFVGWYDDPTAGTLKAGAFSKYTPTGNTTLYAHYADDCASSGEIYSFSINPKPAADIKAAAAAGSVVELVDYADCDGKGTASIGNNSTNQYVYVKSSDGKVYLTGSNSYLKLELACPLEEGDEITFVKSNALKISYTYNAASGTTSSLASGTNTFTIPAESGWIGKRAVYCLYNSNGVNITSVSITRPAPVATYVVTLDPAGGTISPVPAGWTYDDVNGKYIMSDVEDGSKVTLLALTRDGYKLNGWKSGLVDVALSDGKLTVSKDITLTAQWVQLYAVTYDNNGGEGTMTDSNSPYAASAEVTLLDNTFTAPTNKIFGSWVATYNDGTEKTLTIENGKFTMPAYDVTVTAQWVDDNKVAKIGDIYYTSLEGAEGAFANVADGQTIELLKNCDVTAQVEIAAGVSATIDLAGYKIEYTGSTTLPSGVILVHNGASLTINDSSDPSAGSIVSGDKAYAAVALTKLGDDASTPATLVVNGGALTGYYYGITGNGSRNNTVITINGGTITGTVGIAIYHPQVGTLTVNDGSLTGVDAAIEMRAGTLVINDGTFTATATEFSCNPNGSGSTTSGAAIAIAQHTTKKDIEVTINGGTFNGVKALNESNPQVNDPAPQVTMAVTAGTFTGEVTTVDVNNFISGGTFDHEVAANQCAENYAPTSWKDGNVTKYGVKPLATSIDFEALATTHGTGTTDVRSELEAKNYTFSGSISTSNGASWDAATAAKPADKGLKIKGANGATLSFDVAAGKLVTLKVGSLKGGATIAVNGGAAETLTGSNPLSTGASVYTYYYSADVATYSIATTGTDYDVIQSVTIEDPYVVTFNANGGEKVTAMEFHGTALTLPSATKGTEVFKGWYDAAEDGNLIGKAGESYTPTADVTLHAQWEAVSSDATLSALEVDNVALAGFDPETYIYNIVCEYGHTPEITLATATAGDLATVTINNEPVDGVGYKYVQVKVVPQSGEEGKKFYQVRYTNLPKKGVCLIKATHTGAKTADVTGYIGGDYDKNTQGGGKLGGSDQYLGIALANNEQFKAGDLVVVQSTTNSATIELFDTKQFSSKDDSLAYINKGTLNASLTYYYALTADVDWLYLYRTKTAGGQMNPTLGYIEVQRYMDPFIESFKIGEAVGTITGNTIAIELPYGTSLSGVAATVEAYANGGATVDAPASLAYNTPLAYKVSSAYAEDGDVTYTVTITEAAHYEAKIGDVGYATLVEAVAAAVDGDVVELQENVAAGAGVMIAKADAKQITIDFGGYTYTANSPAVGSVGTQNQAFHFEKGCDITLKNGTITSEGSVIKMLIQNYGDLTLEDITLDGTGLEGSHRYVMSNNCGDVVIDDGTTITAKTGDVAFDVCATNYYPDGVTVTVKDGATINGIVEYDVWGTKPANNKAELAIEGGTLNITWNVESALAEDAKENLNVSGGQFSEVVPADYCAEGFAPVTTPNAQGKYEVQDVRVVIFDGSTMSDIATSPSGAISWAKVGDTMGEASKSGTYDEVNYVKALQLKNSSTTKHFKIDVAINNNAKIEVIGMSNDNNDTRHAWLTNSTEKGDFADAIAGLTTTGYNPEMFATDWLEEGSYYLHADNTVNIFLIRVTPKAVDPKCEVPTITAQPETNITFGQGNLTATVEAEVSDDGTLKYQWYNAADDSEVTGQTTATLTTTVEGTYYVIVTNTLANHRDNSIKSDEAQLAYRVMDDATLSALSASVGTLDPTFDKDVINYTVNLAKGTTTVPTLSATATMHPYANVAISDATAFDNYEATSTVVVTSEDGTATKTYTVHYVVAHPVAALVDVTANTTWDWSLVTQDADGAAIGSNGPVVKTEDGLVIANYLIGDNFDKIEGNNGAYSIRSSSRKVYQGASLHFHSTVGGYLSIWAANEGHTMTLNVANAGRDIQIAKLTDSQVEYKVYVQAGDVVIYNVPASGTSPMRVSKLVFTVDETPDYTRNVSSNFGTLCVEKNVVVGGALGATFYQIASRNELYDSKIDFEEVLPNEELKAGEPYLFKSTTGKIELFFGDETSQPVAVRGMIGNYAATTLAIDENNMSTTFYFAQNKLYSCENLVGQNLILNEHRCYIDFTQVPTHAEYMAQQSNGSARRRVSLEMNGNNVATGIENAEMIQEGVQKIMIDGQLFILRGEKMYDATGRLVK